MASASESRRGGRVAAAALLTIACLAVGAAAPTWAGAATTKTAHGRVLQKPCLQMHSFTSTSTPVQGCIPYGTTIAIVCTDAGDKIAGPYGSSLIWDQTKYAGKTGYVTDAWVFTGSNNPAAPPCFGPGKGRVWRSPCLKLRSSTTESAPVLACVLAGLVVPISCTKQGEAVHGPWGTSKVWDHTTYNGTTGYVPDAWVYTATAKPIAHGC